MAYFRRMKGSRSCGSLRSTLKGAAGSGDVGDRLCVWVFLLLRGSEGGKPKPGLVGLPGLEQELPGVTRIDMYMQMHVYLVPGSLFPVPRPQ